VRRSLLVRLGVLVFVTGSGIAFLVWWSQPGHRIDKHGYELIQEGMTVDEVVAVIGVPPGDYATNNTWHRGHYLWMAKNLSNVDNDSLSWKWWLSDVGCIHIDLGNADQRVYIKAYYENTEHNSLLSFWNRICRRFQTGK